MNLYQISIYSALNKGLRGIIIVRDHSGFLAQERTKSFLKEFCVYVPSPECYEFQIIDSDVNYHHSVQPKIISVTWF